MKKIIFISLVLYGCAAPAVTTVWKNEHAYPGKYNKIMVSVILSNEDTSLRARLENNFKLSLQELGYQTISSYAEFGAGGLGDLDQEDAYLALCSKGIDAVMTVALIEKGNDKIIEPREAFNSPSVYYYDHIWHYKKLPLPASDSNSLYRWEMILFELSTLEPHYIMQTRPFRGTFDQPPGHEFWKDMTGKLVREKFLKKHPLIPAGPKSF